MQCLFGCQALARHLPPRSRRLGSGPGEPVTRTKDFRGALENVDVQTVPGVGHLSIDKNQIMQQKVISAIDAAVFHRPAIASVARNPQSLGTAGAAAARN